MEIKLYSAPTAETPAFVPLAVTYDAPSIQYVENFYTFGTFNFSIPAGAYNVGAFQKYLLVHINKEFWGIILSLDKNLDDSGDMLMVSGLCVKGLTSARETMPRSFSEATPSGTAGFDTAIGTTEYCIKHFVQSNFFTAASPTRTVPDLIIAPDLGRGLPNDRYMTRYDRLSTVIQELGEAAEIGYTITPNLATGTLVFDCLEGADRSAEQSTNPRMIFSVDRKNIAAMQYQNNDMNMRNLFYATLSGSTFEDEAYTATYTRNDEPLPSGIYRWEQHLDISATHPTPGQEYDELKRLALIRAQSYTTVEAFSAVVLDTQQKYGVDYSVGDIVTVQNREWGVTMNTRLTAMATNASDGSVTRTATFGTAPVNFIARLRRQIRGG